MRGSQDPRGMTLAKISNRGDTERIEATSSRQARAPVEGLGHPSISKLLTQNHFCLKTDKTLSEELGKDSELKGIATP